jgi:hypothetical protein
MTSYLPMTKWNLATIYFCLSWLMFFGGCFRAIQWRTYSPVEARAKLVFTALISVAWFGLCVHWSIAVVLFVAAFPAYFGVKRRLTAGR